MRTKIVLVARMLMSSSVAFADPVTIDAESKGGSEVAAYRLIDKQPFDGRADHQFHGEKKV
jgi:hypothetical protein